MNSELEFIKLQADIILLQKEIKKLQRENEAISKILVEQVKPVVDSFFYHKEISESDTQEILYG